MNRQLMELLARLPSDSHITAEQLAKQAKLSAKTVRIRLEELDQELKHAGASIETKRGNGYRLVITEPQSYRTWYTEAVLQMGTRIPDTKEERQVYILSMLLSSSGYIKRSDLAEQLHISEKVISQDLKQIDRILEPFGLVVEKKPAYGMRLQGKEYAKRQYLAEWIRRRRKLPGVDGALPKILLEILMDALNSHEAQIPETSLDNLVIYLEVFLQRTKAGFFVTEEFGEAVETTPQEKQIAKELIQQLQHRMSLPALNVYEENYIAVLLRSSRVAGKSGRSLEDINITAEIDALVQKMLNAVEERFGLNFKDDFDFWVMLNYHMSSMDIRLKYYITLTNPILEEIKTDYLYAYAIAEQACVPLNHHYGRRLPEDEIAYFAMLFAMALERRKAAAEFKNLLLVCVTGTISSKFLERRLRQEFAGINNIISCSVSELQNIDLSNVEYVLTTVDLPQPLPVPTVRIKELFDEADRSSLRFAVNQKEIDLLKQYYSEDLFFIDIEGETKEQVIAEICRRIGKRHKLPDDFYDQILLREKYGSTDYQQYVALPHPYETTLQENLVSVAVLKQPIFWERTEVQLVILSVIVNSASEETQQFYDITMKTLMNRDAVAEIIAAKTWEVWLEVLAKNA